MNLSFKVGDDPANVRENRRLFFGMLGIETERLAIPGQVHGIAVSRVGAPGEYPGRDGLITDVPRVFLCISTADCVPILLFDQARRAVAAVHAGWRGTVEAIACTAVEAMCREFGTRPEDLLAEIGPAASQCCYEVGAEVAQRFPGEFVEEREGKLYVDLKGANRRLMLRAGLLEGNLHSSPHCTISDHLLFHSHRRDGARSGRMMGVIGLTV
jgi:hypothetical protein